MRGMLGCLLAGWLAVSAPAWAGAGEPSAANDGVMTFRSDVREVRLAFAATNRNGNTVRNLTSGEVAVVDNESIVRNFRSFSTAAESPLNLIVLLDASGSLAKNFAAEIAAVRQFVEETPWGARDRVSIVTFGGNAAEMICARNCTANDRQHKLDQLRAGGLTPLYDALVAAAEIAGKQYDPEYRAALLVFSDGLDTFSRHSLGEAAVAAQDLQLPIYSVNPCGRWCAAAGGGEALEELAARTGGLCLGSGKSLREFLRAVVDDLHSGYVVTYTLPVQDGQQHRVQVLATRNPNLSFRHRTQYRDAEGSE